MKSYPIDGPSAQAAGVDMLLRRFRSLETDKSTDAPLTPPSSSGSGPIEVSLLVASVDAPANLKRVADYVCDGVADQVEIMAALDALGAFWGGVVQLTQGTYYCSGPINFPTYGGALRGAGKEATYIESSAASPTSSTSFIRTGSTWSFITDMNVGVIHDGYEYAIFASTSTSPTTPVVERVNVRNQGTDSAVYGAINADEGVTLRNVEITYANHSCDGFHAWNGRANIIDCLINYAGSSGNGSGIGIYLSDITQDSSKVRGCTIGTGVTSTGIDIACNKAIVTNNHVFNTGGIQVRSGINDVILDNNYGTVTDLGTNTRIGLATGDTLTDDDAIHDNVAGEISAVTAKATPTSADFLLIEDAAAANVKKRITIGDLPSGSASPLTTKGDLWGFDTDDARLPVGTDTYVLTADSAETLGVKWVAAGSGTDGDAIHDNVAGEISAITAKATPTTSDILLIEDAAASNAKKKITIGDLPGGSGATNTLFAAVAEPATASTSAYATKGNFLRPRADLKIHAVTYYGSIVSGASYRAYVITYSGTTVSTVTAGTVYTADANDVGTATLSASPTLRLVFATPPTLTAGTEYLVAVGRTDSTDTYAMPGQSPAVLGSFPFSTYLPSGSGRIAKAAPAAADTINVVTNAIYRMGIEWEWA